MPFSNRIARLIFATATLLLLALSYTLYKRVLDLDDSYREVNQNNLVKLKLERIRTTLKDAETAQRGFLLTQDSQFLKPYNGAYEKIQTILNQVRTLTVKNVEQQKNLDALATFVEVRFRAFENQVNQFSIPGITLTSKKLHLLSGMAAMEQMENHIKAIARTEDELLKAREERKKLFQYMTPLFALTLIVTILAIIAFSYVKIIEQLKRTKELLKLLRSLNKKLKQKNYELEVYNKELDSFTYIASHDLKEPLRKILTFSAMIEEGEDPVSERNRASLEKIRQSAKRMQNLLNDLLQYSHTSMAEKKFETVDLDRVIENVKLNLEDELHNSDAEIVTNSLPVVKGLSFQLKQLFENLINNSIKYRRSDVPPRITISGSFISRDDVSTTQPKESSFYHKIIYSDNGIGFSQVHAEKIFELFRRVHVRQQQSGTGIGLTICKKIVQNHNGFITAKSEVNKGAIFEIYLPYDELTIHKKEEILFSM